MYQFWKQGIPPDVYERQVMRNINMMTSIDAWMTDKKKRVAKINQVMASMR